MLVYSQKHYQGKPFNVPWKIQDNFLGGLLFGEHVNESVSLQVRALENIFQIYSIHIN
jgi:hypothetical protein